MACFIILVTAMDIWWRVRVRPYRWYTLLLMFSFLDESCMLLISITWFDYMLLLHGEKALCFLWCLDIRMVESCWFITLLIYGENFTAHDEVIYLMLLLWHISMLLSLYDFIIVPTWSMVVASGVYDLDVEYSLMGCWWPRCWVAMN